LSNGPRSKDFLDLGDILQAAHLVEPAKLAQLRGEAQKRGRPLWHALTHDEVVTADALFRALRQEVRVPVLAADQLPAVSVPPELLKAVPAKTAQRMGMMPLERSTDGRRAGLAMVDPTDDITPLWPALSAAGVSEVRRFLVHLSTLRLGLEAFYGVAWVADSELVEAPSPAPGQPEKSEAAIEVDPEPLTEEEEEGASLAELVAAANHSGSALAPVKGTGPVPKVDPAAVAAPVRATPSAAHSAAHVVSAPIKNSGPSATAGLQPAKPIAAATPLSYRVRREVSLPELPASDIIMLDEKSRPLRVPILDEASLPAFRASSAAAAEKEPLGETLLALGEAFAAVVDEDTHSTRPGAIARLSQSVAERLGFAPRAVSELKLIARLYGVLRTRLRRAGPLPAETKDMLGFDSVLPLQTALRTLQSVFVDFMLLPTEPDMVPMGTRIVLAATTTVDLIDSGLTDDALVSRVRSMIADSMIAGALIGSLQTDLPALGIDREPAPAVSSPASGSPLLAPKGPHMPDVTWRTRSVAQLPDEALSPYSPPSGSVGIG
jgi:hypothetical protein